MSPWTKYTGSLYAYVPFRKIHGTVLLNINFHCYSVQVNFSWFYFIEEISEPSTFVETFAKIYPLLTLTNYKLSLCCCVVFLQKGLYFWYHRCILKKTEQEECVRWKSHLLLFLNENINFIIWSRTNFVQISLWVSFAPKNKISFTPEKVIVSLDKFTLDDFFSGMDASLSIRVS